MNLKELKDKKILLFGKSRAFGMDEFLVQLKFHKIGLASEFEEGIELIVEGKMMTPYEQRASDELYEKKSQKLEFVSIDVLEKELAKEIDENTLLMSLKLSHDKERLKNFIQNSTISDELFFKLIKMYKWSGEDFFENDSNRDVSAAIILRFYKNIERNHNVQYATSGFVHLIAQTDNKKLIEIILELEPLQNSANSKIKTLIAMRNDCDEKMQTALYDSMDESVLEALCRNENLSKNVLFKLLSIERYADDLARHAKLDNELFERFLQNNPLELAKNGTLTQEMQERLIALDDKAINFSLASNRNISDFIIKKLLSCGSFEIKSAVYKNPITPVGMLKEAYEEKQNHISLAHNESTPKYILSAMADELDAEVLKGLAKNPSTPVEVLYQLQLDSGFARAVKENPAFGRHIQQENIGWEV
ncbi:MAG: hypothetical protein PHO62_03685 [Sulfurimonas sp.]|uniref:hypothetical protein n=1 Tax=Sulfurimonas sp. TaxID=2022749 RepID=UPI00262F29E8|nr:hypothetical protein [Sulfurimonas sp.]MDD5372514.1 hypothetical protein [Sulfurimonas sp.]